MADFIHDNLRLIMGLFIGLFALLIVLLPVGITVASYQNVEQHTCTIEDKDRVAQSEGGSEMRVYTDCGNFVVQDAMFRQNFHSSDTFRELEVGKTYKFETIGFRVPFFSVFPNIVQIHGEV